MLFSIVIIILSQTLIKQLPILYLDEILILCVTDNRLLYDTVHRLMLSKLKLVSSVTKVQQQL